MTRKKYNIDHQHLITAQLESSMSPTSANQVKLLHCIAKKHVTTFSMISWTRTVRLQRFLAHLLPRV